MVGREPSLPCGVHARTGTAFQRLTGVGEAVYRLSILTENDRYYVIVEVKAD